MDSTTKNIFISEFYGCRWKNFDTWKDSRLYAKFKLVDFCFNIMNNLYFYTQFSSGQSQSFSVFEHSTFLIIDRLLLGYFTFKFVSALI